MKNFTIISLLFLSLMACTSGKDEQFCKCLKAGEELNEYSTKLWSEEINDEKASKLKSLKEIKRKECTNYQTMDGAEMIKRKKECAE